MFKRAAWQIAGDASVQNAVASIGHEIEPAAGHASIEEDVDGRDKPGHDGLEAAVPSLRLHDLHAALRRGDVVISRSTPPGR
jgi:hypothetical protein